MLRKHILSAIIVLAAFIAGCSKDKGSGGGNNNTSNVNATTNVQYGQNTNFSKNSQKLLMDIYSPKDASASNKYPLVVMAHSGSFLEGDKEGLGPLCQAIADKGFIAVTIDYRLGWDYGTGSPAACGGDVTSLTEAVYRAMQDYNASLRYLVHNANKYFIDTNWVFVGGSSAGAVAAVNTIYSSPDFVNTYFAAEKAALGPLRTADNDLTDAVTIRGDINLWGGVITDSLITSATAVPMVAFHGSDDGTIPIDVDHYALCPNYPLLYGSRAMYNKLVSLGVPAVLHIAQGQGHGPALYTDDADFVATNISCFLEGIIGKTQKSATYNNKASECQ